MIVADQLVAHLVGDYVLQSDWMAGEKTKKSVAALAHTIVYTLAFLLLTLSWKALLVIAGTHFVIDRWRLARYVVWAKNFLAPKQTSFWSWEFVPRKPGEKDPPFDPLATDESGPHLPVGWPPGRFIDKENITRWWHPWAECEGTGYHKDRPPFLAVWLLIIADNTMHIVINGLALAYLS